MIFTDRIRLLLKVQHKTAKQMLEDLEFNKDQLKIWEGKGIVPKRIFVSAIADYLNTTPEYLRGERTTLLRKTMKKTIRAAKSFPSRRGL